MRLKAIPALLAYLLQGTAPVGAAPAWAAAPDNDAKPAEAAGPPQDPTLLEELKKLPDEIIYNETNQDDDWELMMVNADGSKPVNLTKRRAHCGPHSSDSHGGVACERPAVDRGSAHRGPP